MSVNSLGEFAFVSFANPNDAGAPPLLVSMEGGLQQRPGVDGSSVMRLGVKGQPFPMKSCVDCLTFAGANDELSEYMAAVNDEPLLLIWGSVNYFTSYQTMYLPIRCEPIRIRRISGCAGGINGSTATAWLEALWTLLPLRAVTEDA